MIRSLLIWILICSATPAWSQSQEISFDQATYSFVHYFREGPYTSEDPLKQLGPYLLGGTSYQVGTILNAVAMVFSLPPGESDPEAVSPHAFRSHFRPLQKRAIDLLLEVYLSSQPAHQDWTLETFMALVQMNRAINDAPTNIATMERLVVGMERFSPVRRQRLFREIERAIVTSPHLANHWGPLAGSARARLKLKQPCETWLLRAQKSLELKR